MLQLLFSALAVAQVVFREGTLRQQAPVMMQQLAISAVVQKADDAKSSIYVFGTPVQVDHVVDWVQVSSDVKVHQLKIKSDGAVSLNLVFESFEMSAGSEMYLTYANQTIGPYTQYNNKPSGQFATMPIETSQLTIQLFSPVDEFPKLKLSKVIYGFRTVGKSGQCNKDAACNSEWDAPSRSVAMILTADGTGFCSGAMVNSAYNDGRQYFLTAYHCVGHNDVSNNMLLFNYQEQTCGSVNSTAPRTMTAHGMVKITQGRQSDFALLELQERIPESYNVHMAGWSAAMQPATGVVGIHHPSADVKKISHYNRTVQAACWSWCSIRDDQNHWKIESWTSGITEPGSSGSPLFNVAQKRIVGQLHGGSASCYNRMGYDSYGAFAWSYDKYDSNLKSALVGNSTLLEDGVDGADLNVLRGSSPKLVLQK